MRLLKTVLLSTTLLVGSTVFASGDVPTELAAVDKATQGFLDTVGKIKTEHATYLNVVNKQVKRLGGTQGDTFLKALGALKSSIDAVLTQQTTLETDLATARDDVEKLTAENERLKAAQSQSVARPLNYDAQLDAAQSLAAIRARRTAASVGETQSEVSDRHSMGSGSTAQVIAVLNGNPIADVSELSPFKNESTGGSPAGDNPLRSLLGPHVPVLDDQTGSAHAASPTAAGANTPSQAASQPTTPRAKAAKGDNVATTPVVARPSARPATPAPEAGPTTAGDAATPDAEARPAADETAVDPNAVQIERLQGEIEVHKKLLTLPHATGGHTERTRGDREQPQTHSTAKQRTTATNAIERLKAGLAVLNATN